MNLDEERLRNELKPNKYGNYNAQAKNPAVVIIDGKWKRRCEKIGICYYKAFHGCNKAYGRYFPIIRGIAISVLDAHLIPGNLEKDKLQRYMKRSVGEALHIVNKAAKRRRNAASNAYVVGNYGFASMHKDEKEEYYELKDRVVERAIDCGLASYSGLHSKIGVQHNKEKVYHDDDCDCRYCQAYSDGDRYEPGWDIEYEEEQVTQYFHCYEIDGFRFHVPAEEPDEGVECKDLGEWMSESKPYDSSFPIKYAIARLEIFLEEENEAVE